LKVGILIEKAKEFNDFCVNPFGIYSQSSSFLQLFGRC
jgi:hypothetical protein